MSDTATLEAAPTRYTAAIKGDGSAEFVAAKVALVELFTGRTLDAEEIAYL
ncbi:hypothetical protein [Rhodococcus qingshengii]|uniref:hypothetical protein n=1 Tax=Rhodococcus qingshengii TaxID=334542 RepID=UPI0015D4E309|nr:hypothetical protein [Rhodococcus qingshengii]